MKTLVVVCALVACSAAVPQGWGYSTIDSGLWGNALISPSLYAASAPLAYMTLAAPLAYSSLAAPSLALTRTVAAAPSLALTRTVAAAPAVAVTRTVAAAPVIAAPAPVVAAAPAVTKTQYHSQDELGQASYGHAEPLQTHNAVQDAHGNKVGSFSYLNPHDGQIHRTDYVADALGYRVAANDLPVDTAEVAIAKAAHLSAHVAARSKRSVVALAHTPASTAPLATLSYAAPLAYSAPIAAPLSYSAPLAAPIAAPALREATLTTVVNTPGHAVSYRVD